MKEHIDSIIQKKYEKDKHKQELEQLKIEHAILEKKEESRIEFLQSDVVINTEESINDSASFQFLNDLE